MRTPSNCKYHLIDHEYLDELREVLSDRPVDRLVTAFIGGLNSATQEIVVLVLSKRFVAVRSAAHALRGAALGLGCSGVARLCRQIEMGDGDNKDLADELLIAAQLTTIALSSSMTLGDELKACDAFEGVITGRL